MQRYEEKNETQTKNTQKVKYSYFLPTIVVFLETNLYFCI